MRAQTRGWVRAIGVTLWLGTFVWERPVLSAPSPPSSSDYTIEAWQVEHGLPQSSVTSIAQTPDGYLWLATFNGLVRFDGVRFTVFDDGNTPALESSRLVRLDVDTEGRLWIISENGRLTCLKEGQFKNFTAADGFPLSGAAGVFRGPQDRWLLLDRQGGVRQFSNEKWEPSPHWEFQEKEAASLFADGRDQLWVCFRPKRTLGRLVGNQVVLLKEPGGRQDIAARAFARSRCGGLWVALTNSIWHYDTSLGWQSTAWTLPEPVRGLTCMLEDRRGNLWVSTYGHGLVRFDPSGFCERFTAEGAPRLSHNAIRALLEDKEGSLWVGTDGGGLDRLKPRLVATYDLRHGLTAPVVMSIAQDRNEPQTLWLGLNGGGVNRLQAGQATPLVLEPLLSTNHFVYSVFGDRQGGLWIGNYDVGILRYHNQTLTALDSQKNWNGQPLLAVLEDHLGRMWFAGSFGLLRWEGNQYTNLNAELKWSGNPIRALAEDQLGNLYVGSSGGGLSRWSQGLWTQFREKDGLADNHLNALWVDASNTLWIGTVNRGLSRFKDGRFTTYSTHEGLPGNSIAAILEDDSGNLWIGSNRGLFRVAKDQLEELAAGRRSRLAGFSYGIADGLNSLECGRACKGADGRLWFATSKGVAVVDPAKLPVNSLPPQVVIEDVLIDEQNQIPPSSPPQKRAAPVRVSSQPPVAPLTSQLVVPARSDRVEFRFTALSFLAPEKVQFRYQLESYDRQWVEAGSRRAASYMRLPPGRYRFRVTACNNDGIWNHTGAALGVVVLPPWWMTWWFRTLAITAAVCLVVWAIEVRVRRIKREHAAQRALSRRLLETQEAERKRIAAELHDGLGQNLLVIKNRAMLALQDPAATAKSSEQFNEISSMASTTLAEVRQISHDLRPYQLDRLGLTRALKAMVTGVAAASGIRCVAELDPVDGLVAAPMEIHCYRIVQELLNNVVKHSHASEARVAAKVQERKILLVVEDDGCGFNFSEVCDKANGAGLTGIMERIRIVGGSFNCETGRAGGTRWTFEIPTTPKTDL